ncbi:peptidoglycan-binding domain-containing protein [Gammaproteobacteria bacterium]|nr:peptidoglycan-binding domain-containing protein [Gammaproteobacteria bacterium]
MDLLTYRNLTLPLALLLLSACSRTEWIHPSLPQSMLEVSQGQCSTKLIEVLGRRPQPIYHRQCYTSKGKQHCSMVQINSAVPQWENNYETGMNKCMLTAGWKPLKVNSDGMIVDQDGNPLSNYEDFVASLEAEKLEASKPDPETVPDFGDADWNNAPNSATSDNRAATDNKTVALVQKRLNVLGINAGSADGKMGPKTRAAIKAFQANSGLPETGSLDKKTIERLLQ